MSDLRVSLVTALRDGLSGPLKRLVGGAGSDLQRLGQGADRVGQAADQAGAKLLGMAGKANALGTANGPARLAAQVGDVAAAAERAAVQTNRLMGMLRQLPTLAAGLAGVGTGLVLGKNVLADPMQRAANYDTRLRHLANTAFSGQSMDQKEAGKQALGEAVAAAVRTGGGGRDTAVTALGELIASGQFGDARQSMAALPIIQKTAVAGDADATDIARIAITGASNFRLRPDRLETTLGRAMASGQMGQFELKDMAAALPSQMAAARGLGMGGEDDFMRLLAANQAARTTAGTSSKAATNLEALLSEINSVTTTGTIGKMGIDKSGTMAAALGKGMDSLSAFLALADQIVAKDPAFQKAKASFNAAGSSDEKAAIAQSQMSLLQGGALGKITGRQEAMLALVGLLNNREVMDSQVEQLRGAGGSTIDNAHAFIAKGAGYAFEQREFARQQAQTAAMEKLNDSTSTLARLQTELYERYPGFSMALEGATVMVTALATAAGAAAGVLALLKVAGGGAPAPAGGVAPAAAAGAAGGVLARAGAAGVAGLVGYGVGTALYKGTLEGNAAGDAVGRVVTQAMAVLGSDEANASLASRDKLAAYERDQIKAQIEERTSVALRSVLPLTGGALLNGDGSSGGGKNGDSDRIVKALETLGGDIKALSLRPVEVTLDGSVVKDSVNRHNARDARRQ